MFFFFECLPGAQVDMINICRGNILGLVPVGDKRRDDEEHSQQCARAADVSLSNIFAGDELYSGTLRRLLQLRPKELQDLQQRHGQRNKLISDSIIDNVLFS